VIACSGEPLGNICPELVAFLDFGCTKTICFEKDHTRHNGSLVSDWNNFELLFYRILCYICLVGSFNIRAFGKMKKKVFFKDTRK
jgi:hypothetical protein